jgi:curved DNA-binding protein CbpA
MIVNPIVAAAAVAARAVGTIFPGDWMARRPDNVRPRNEPSFREAFPANQYFVGMEENWHDQSRELDEFLSTTPIIIQDAEILSKETTNQNQGRTKPPPLPDTDNPFILLGIQPGASFDVIRSAYREMAKVYHPDVVVGPDATADERKEANWDFARVNEAFDILKRREHEEVFEYSIYVDGNQEVRSVVMSDEYGQSDPYRINYDRIIEMSEYRKRRPRTRMWYEDDRSYPPRHNDFEPYSVDAYSKGKWWLTKGFDAFDDEFGHIPSREKLWEERQIFERQEVRRSGFGVNPVQDQWWDEGSAFDDTTTGHYHEYQSRNSRQNHAQMKQGHPYKDRISNGWTGPVESPHSPVESAVDYDPRGCFAPKEKWWKGDETVAGNFSP